MSEEIYPGDIVAVQHGVYGRKEGLVVGSHFDHAGRQILEVQLEPGEVYHAWFPTVKRITRTVSYPGAYPVQNLLPARPATYRTVERRILW